jgi:hypothetical protein
MIVIVLWLIYDLIVISTPEAGRAVNPRNIKLLYVRFPARCTGLFTIVYLRY